HAARYHRKRGGERPCCCPRRRPSSEPVNSIVVHYQELAPKGKNPQWFPGRLVRHLRHAVSDLDVTAVRALMGRIEIVLGPSVPLEAVSERVRQTFGVANFSL